MSIQLGDEAPDFSAETTEGTISFHGFLGDSWGVLFSHPADFTPVCTTELGRVAVLKGEFEKRNMKVVGLSVDPLGSGPPHTHHDLVAVWSRGLDARRTATAIIAAPPPRTSSPPASRPIPIQKSGSSSAPIARSAVTPAEASVFMSTTFQSPSRGFQVSDWVPVPRALAAQKRWASGGVAGAAPVFSA